jgi:glycerol-3-phosphate dehydrogenase (NAD+)
MYSTVGRQALRRLHASVLFGGRLHTAPAALCFSAAAAHTTGAANFSTASTTTSLAGQKIAVIGSGNWGSVAAKLVGENAASKSELFQNNVNMWVFEEDYQGEKLTDVINREHENVKYLPGVPLGANITAVPNLLDAVRGASLLVFVTPHQFIKGLCREIKASNVLADDACAVSLIKGMDVTENGFELISGLIQSELGVKCSVLMGANIANEVGEEKFSESTVGAATPAQGEVWRELFGRPYFDVAAVDDVVGVELCGTLKNIVAIGAGFVDGLGLGNNAKAAIIRIGLVEMRALSKHLFPTVSDATFLESCGVADLITTCFGGRNRKCAEAFVVADGKKSFDDIEAELLGGQKLQGRYLVSVLVTFISGVLSTLRTQQISQSTCNSVLTGVLTSNEVQAVLQRYELEAKFPLFTTINRICSGQIPPERIAQYKTLPTK